MPDSTAISLFDSAQEVLSLFESLLTIAAILLGGFWTYRLYRQKRQKYPRAEVHHALAAWAVDEDHVILRVTVGVENKGEVLVRPSDGQVWLQVVRPWPSFLSAVSAEPRPLVESGTEAPWPILEEMYWKDAKVEVEPGETHFFSFDFRVSSRLKTIVLYSHVVNTTKLPWFERKTRSSLGWSTNTTHEIDARPMPEESRKTDRPSDKGSDQRDRLNENRKSEDHRSGPTGPLTQSEPKSRPKDDDIVNKLKK